MMEREIKFRRYHFLDKEKTKLGYVSEWGFGIDLQSHKPEFISPSYVSNAIYTADCQFTGLKDKKGKEIYEGDVVQFVKVKSKDANYCYPGSTVSSNTPETYNGVIRYDEGGYVIADAYAYPFDRPLINWCVAYIDGDRRLNCLHVQESRIASDHSAEYNNLEVIGNIYETPELLNP